MTSRPSIYVEEMVRRESHLDLGLLFRAKREKKAGRDRVETGLLLLLRLVTVPVHTVRVSRHHTA